MCVELLWKYLFENVFPLGAAVSYPPQNVLSLNNPLDIPPDIPWHCTYCQLIQNVLKEDPLLRKKVIVLEVGAVGMEFAISI